MNSETSEAGATVAIPENSLEAVVAVLANIVEMSCEHEPDLELMRLVNLLDLYRTYLTHEIDSLALEEGGAATYLGQYGGRRKTDCVSFEYFIGNSTLLQIAAQAASQDTGVVVSAPLPLKQSANSCRGPAGTDV